MMARPMQWVACVWMVQGGRVCSVPLVMIEASIPKVL